MTREWTVVIPRRADQVSGLSANAAGMMGLVWVSTEEEMEKWKRKGPWGILGELGMKADDGDGRREGIMGEMKGV